MKILMVSSEAVPYAKTGGLADMVSSLSLALAKLGHETRLVIPRYYGVDRGRLDLLEGPLGVPSGGAEEWSAVYTAVLPGSPKKNPVRVFFIDHEKFFGRDGIYGVPSEPDFLDNPRRFSFFCRACFQLCRKTNWFPDIFHAHDWPAALVPVFLKFGERQGPFSRSVSALTIHNLGYQGIYSKENFYCTGLGWNVFYDAGFEDGNMLNLLKAGLWSADILNTVSPKYAEETKTQASGFRLDGVLRAREADYRGILNGIDTSIWNPGKDPYLTDHYRASDLAPKARNKALLQETFGLPQSPEVPVIGMVARLTDQKGVGELFGPSYGSAYSICHDMNLQFVILGSGAPWCENELRALASRLPNFKARIGYDEKTCHLIEAGSDFFLMPSRYEPSGLNQMYSLAYGTIPIVRNTGGLADTVKNFDQRSGGGTGFMFDDLTPSAIYNTVGWAVWAWYNRREQIEAMRRRGMKEDHSWTASAKQYAALYEEALAKAAPPDPRGGCMPVTRGASSLTRVPGNKPRVLRSPRHR
ncbi:MAG: glycogen synthase (Starch [bacterial glycogen]synthase) [Treponematales bacterium]